MVGALAASPEDPVQPAGLPAAVAVRAARAGARVELVSRIGDDGDGDAVLLALSRAGVGHVAVLRDAARSTPRATASEGAAHESVVPTDSSPPNEPPGGTAGTHSTQALAPADLELGLRYLTDFSVVVVADSLDEAALGVVADAAAFASAHVVATVSGSTAIAGLLPSASTILEGPADASGSYAELVAAYAVALDAGLAPRDAFDHAIRRTGTEAAAGD